MRKLLLALLMLYSSTCHGGEAFIAYGVGIFGSADYHMGQVKMANVGYRTFLVDGLYWQFKGGYWGDGSPAPNRSQSFYVSSGPGLEVSLQSIEIRSGWALAVISNPDSYLGSRFPQFNGELYLGLRDKRGGGIGVQYEHVSCAGFCTPNLGRDFLILQLSQKW